jgi:hypothetical protein
VDITSITDMDIHVNMAIVTGMAQIKRSNFESS